MSTFDDFNEPSKFVRRTWPQIKAETIEKMETQAQELIKRAETAEALIWLIPCLFCTFMAGFECGRLYENSHSSPSGVK